MEQVPANGDAAPGQSPAPVAFSGRLSPSRAGDFTTCPLLYRFRSIDRLPEPPTRATARGTLVHLVLERLFDTAADERTLEHAQSLVAGAWETLAENPDYSALVSADDENAWLAEAEGLVAKYFQMEDPSQVHPQHRESPVEFQVADDLVLRGLVDRMDVEADGRVVIVDYKTGRAPSQDYEHKAMFQMRFYALVVWRQTGVIPSELRLMYLADGQMLTDRPSQDDLLATQRRVLALWEAIKGAHRAGEFRPRPSVLCRWCHFMPLCPAHDGTAPPLPRQG